MPLSDDSTTSSGVRQILLRRLVVNAPLGLDARSRVAVDVGDGQSLLDWAAKERVLGCFWHASQDVLQLEPEQMRDLRRWFVAACQHTMSVDGSLPPVAEAFERAGIEWRVLKGIATARTAYPSETWRQYVDVDVLVRYADLDRSLETLRHVTSKPGPVQAGPARTWVVKEHALVDVRGIEIDVHFGVQGSLVSSRLDNDVLFEAPQMIEIDGRSVPALSEPAMLVHAALHVSSAGWKMSSVPDVALLCRRVSPDDPQFERLTERPAVRHLFVWALMRVGEWTPLPAPWGAYVRQHALARSRFEFYRWVHGREERMRVANAFLGPQRGRRIVETVWPQQAFLDEQGLSRTGNLARIAGAGRAATRAK